ncbi:3-oxoacyl-[acyl-carrier-protein] synthase-3 [Nonlabens dokdonensis]|jgi:3-oxoacyl-[acyl-carrier-protein] synthase-3|uniref:Beta-ketoacyl-[acyl-carrier-protein] synthase III n=2 Tax=Nonlabens dokdonensis TaxID=328515 RepID=L7W883_NONDD|nr:beta-ketoacyl-ACP synthase III [Nonlabens dokdonensis]AGC76354.1 3-oxoacyl-[acyl-carrier-protein] synthase III [Nonlabens dokdonensis DSW-6]PZX44014.1 3-oxoacyl-[acyl-carrier-protein] synthase-3 [Nonlabens dokdonensis]
MSNIKAAITAVGAYTPEYKLTNAILETMVDTNDEWIFSRTGIKERRILKDKDKGASYLAIKAAEDLISSASLDPKTIDLVLVATVTPDMPVASTAAYVASQIGATNAFSYDLMAACSGFLYGMSTASSYIESGRYKKVLLIGADKMSSIIDYEDRTTCIIFGDGGGAVLFEPNHEGYGFEDEILRTDGIGRNFLKIEAGGSLLPASHETVDKKQHYVFQDGKNVFKYAVSNMADVSEQIVKRNNLTNEDISWLVPHQANKRIIDATARRVNLPEEKVMMNIQKYGNTTSATLPLLLKEYETQLKKGDQLVFAAFGGGFTWGSILLSWAYDS